MRSGAGDGVGGTAVAVGGTGLAVTVAVGQGVGEGAGVAPAQPVMHSDMSSAAAMAAFIQAPYLCRLGYSVYFRTSATTSG